MVDGIAGRPGGDPAGRLDRGPIAAFLWFDLRAAVAGILVLAVLNGLFVRVTAIWLILPSLLILVAALTLAGRWLAAGLLLGPLGLLTTANWLVAVTVAVILPFMWPVMVVTAIMPVILVTPYLDSRRLAAAIAGAGATVVAAASVGLANDDGGAIPDLVDWAEFLLVIGGLGALVVPCGLIVWHANRVQAEELRQAVVVNDELRRARDELVASRRRVVEAADNERRRIERDLHDGAQQRLVALVVGLRLLQGRTADRPDLDETVADLAADANRAIEELRELANGIHSPVLRSHGLPGALRAAARRSPLPVELTLDELDRPDPSIETALHFVALEALTNAAKHAPEASVAVALSAEDDGLRLVVEDDGPGFDPTGEARSNGLDNMADRLAAIGGRLTIDAAPGRGTRIIATVDGDVADRPGSADA
jgi:signal transduction histidine kinase